MQSELLVAYSATAPDGGPKSDGIGDACDGQETVIGTTGNASITGTAETGAPTSLTDNDTLFGATNSLFGRTITISSGLGAGQTRDITANTGATVTITPRWSTNPNNTSVYFIWPTTPSGSCTDSTDNEPDSANPGGGTDSTDADCRVTFSQNGIAGIVVDLSPTVSNGHYHVKADIMPTCYDTPTPSETDADGDGWCESTEGAAKDGSALLHPKWSDFAIGGDHDGDGQNAWIETFIGSEDALACNGNTVKGDEPLVGEPTDFNDDTKTDIFDINVLKPAFFKDAFNNPGVYIKAVDLNADGKVDIFDVNIFKPKFFNTCTITPQQ